MSKKYNGIPSNFKDFENYILYKKEDVTNAFAEANKYFFYDTCSILHHSNSTNRQKIINFLKTKAGIIVITRTVLMELTANSFKLHPVQIQYFKELFDNGLKIILLDEEVIYDCLKEALSISSEDCNKLLGYAVKEVSKYKAKTCEVIENMDKPTSNKIKGTDPGSKELFSTFFQYARSLKCEGDSLAEELILICIIVLTRIPLGRYILISDDMRARPQVISVSEYIQKHHRMTAPYQLTTSSLIYRMYKEVAIENRDEMIEILQSAFIDSVYVYFVGEFDISSQYNSFKCEDLVDRIINEKEFRVIY